MTNTDITNDPYLIDPAEYQAQKEAMAGGSSVPKVNWLNFPQGNATSEWRIMPFPFLKGAFCWPIRKHYRIPGLKGSLVCPRSFMDESNRPYFCEICDKFFDFRKSDDAAKKAVSQILRSNTCYLVNAVSCSEESKGVGVLTLPYQVHKTLDSWITTPGSPYVHFSHPTMGRNILITSSTVAGSKIPDSDKEKREYVVMPGPMATPLSNMDWLEQLYDLRTVLGVPTVEFTKLCLERLLTGNEKLELPSGVKAYRGQLTAGNEPSNQDISFDVVDSTPPPTTYEAAAAAPAFAATPTSAPVSSGSDEEMRKRFQDILSGKKNG